VFNGAPKKIAEKYQNTPYGQRIEIDLVDEDRIKVATTGFPSNDGVWVIASDCEALAGEVTTVSPSKKTMIVKTWWNKEEEQLLTTLYYPDIELTAFQRRFFSEDGKLRLEVSLRKEGFAGIRKKCHFDAVFEKVIKEDFVMVEENNSFKDNGSSKKSKK
jgi:hypothetical protein